MSGDPGLHRDADNPYIADAGARTAGSEERKGSVTAKRAWWVLPVVAALVLGVVVGYLAAGHKDAPHGTAIPNAPPTGPSRYTVPIPGNASQQAVAKASIPDSYSLLFTRRANGVTIRAFLDGGSESVSGATQGCPNGPPLVAEISTSRMVGVAVSWGAPSSELYPAGAADRADILGAAEGGPVAVIVAEAGPEVRQVRVRTSADGGATDSMAPVYGWAVLAVPVPAVSGDGTTQLGTLEAFGPGGREVANDALRVGSPVVAWFGYAPLCVLSPVPAAG